MRRPAQTRSSWTARARRVAVLVLVLGLSGVLTTALVRLPGSEAAFVATVTNTANSASSYPYFTCRTAALGQPGSTRAVVAYSLTDASGLSAADASGNSYNGTYSSTGVTYQQPGPCPRDSPASKAATFDGSTGSVSGPNGLYGGPNVFSIEIWFSTSTKAGKLAGFGSSVTGASVNADRHLYIDSFGKLVFGVNPGTYQVATTPSPVTDGLWHHAVATLSSAGMKLYLDGNQVATNPTTTAGPYSGYVRIGYDSLAGWPNRPTSDYFAGSLAWAEVYLYALTPAQVTSHYLAGR